jgi:hypothetical protein
MKQYKTGRVLATLFLGVMFGIYKHFDQMRWLGRGRDAFLAHQRQLFDKFSQYHSSTGTLIAGVILAAVAIGLYELIAAGITHVLPPSTVEE